MFQEEKVSLTISITKSYRDRLRTMAAQRNLHDPNQLTSASTLAREIICDHLDNLNCMEPNFVGEESQALQPTAHSHDNAVEPAKGKGQR